MQLILPIQPEIKTGFVFLHSCDGCSSHQPVIDLAQDMIFSVLDLLQLIQRGPRLPPNPSDYTGNYSTGAVKPVRHYSDVEIMRKICVNGKWQYLKAKFRNLIIIILDYTMGHNVRMLLFRACMKHFRIRIWPHSFKFLLNCTHTHTHKTSAVVELTTDYDGNEALLLIDSGDRVILDWREGDEFQQSLHGGPQPCANLGRGHIGEWVYFSRSTSGQVESFTIPGLAYGVVYKRMQ